MIHENYGERIEQFEQVLQKVATNMLREEIVKHVMLLQRPLQKRRSRRLRNFEKDRSLFPGFRFGW